MPGRNSIIVLLLFVFLSPISAQAQYSISVEDLACDVVYDLHNANGSYLGTYNSSEVVPLDISQHYVLLLHPEPLRVASDPKAFFVQLGNYGYVIVTLVFLAFVGGSLFGAFGSVFLKRARGG